MLQDNPGNSGQDDLYRARLESIIDLRHELAKLARLVDWDGLQQDLSQFYCADRGRPGGSVRLMAGLLLLKDMKGLSTRRSAKSGARTPIFNAEIQAKDDR